MGEFAQLKQAILDNNMSAVCRVYEELTGEPIKPQKKARGRKTVEREPNMIHPPSTLAPPEPPPAPPDPPVNPEIAALQEQINALTQVIQTNIGTAQAQPARQRPRFGGGPNRFNPEAYGDVAERGEEFIDDNVTPTPRGSIPREHVDIVPNEDIPMAPGMRGR